MYEYAHKWVSGYFFTKLASKHILDNTLVRCVCMLSNNPGLAETTSTPDQTPPSGQNKHYTIVNI